MAVQPDQLPDGCGGAFLEVVTAIVRDLRRRRVVVSSGQVIDAVRALAVVDATDARQLRIALESTLVKRTDDRPALEAALAALAARRHAPDGSMPPEDLHDELVSAVQRGDDPAMRSLVGHAVDVFGGLDEDSPTRTRYHQHRTLRQLDLSRLLARACGQDGLDEQTLIALQARVASLEAMVTDAVNERLADTGSGAFDTDDLAELDFLNASAAELERLREVVRPLARRLAMRLVRRQWQQRTASRIDMRRTIRQSLGQGGVPVEVVYQRTPVRKPELVVLADLSGSVAEFARFFLLLLHALHEELPRVRSFCFVDDIDEVTQLLESLPERLQISHLLRTTRIVGVSGHSDYGAVFTRFSDRFADALSPRTTVLIAGDGRSNGRDPGVGALSLMRGKARRVYWLNPEPRALWDTRDSTIGRYAKVCDDIVEVRNVDQLSDFIVSLA